MKKILLVVAVLIIVMASVAQCAVIDTVFVKESVRGWNVLVSNSLKQNKKVYDSVMTQLQHDLYAIERATPEIVSKKLRATTIALELDHPNQPVIQYHHVNYDRDYFKKYSIASFLGGTIHICDAHAYLDITRTVRSVIMSGLSYAFYFQQHIDQDQTFKQLYNDAIAAKKYDSVSIALATPPQASILRKQEDYFTVLTLAISNLSDTYPYNWAQAQRLDDKAYLYMVKLWMKD